jgi:superfamily II DNA/RNA helicase
MATLYHQMPSHRCVCTGDTSAAGTRQRRLYHTLELAYQIKNEYLWFTKYMPDILVGMFFGGTPDVERLNDRSKCPHITFATFGTLSDTAVFIQEIHGTCQWQGLRHCFLSHSGTCLYLQFMKYMPGVLVRRGEYYVAQEQSETDAELLKDKSKCPHIIVATPGHLNALV